MHYIVVIIGLRNAFAPDRRQAISQTNDDFSYTNEF